MKIVNTNIRPIIRNTILSTLLALGIASYADETTPKFRTHRFHQENAMILEDLSIVIFDRNSIQMLEEKIKRDEREGNDYAINKDKKDLLQATADLKRSESFLAADKKDLEKDYRKSIKEHKNAIKQNKAELRKNKISLRNAIWKENESSIEQSARKVADGQKKVRSEQEKLANEKANRKADLAIINDEIKRSKEELKAVKTIETTTYSHASSNTKKGCF